MIIRRIEVLEPQLANKIAAGEVVERPASVVKELVENSLDAGASSVTVEIREGGAEYIRITDNGCGIPSEDVKKAFLRHATSKLHSVEGLDGIETLGFRGEALASIAAVSKVSMRTRTENEENGTLISLEGGAVRELAPCGCPMGTTIEVRELFYNVPARLKFLKSARAESAAVGDYMLRLILGDTNVSFKFINGGKPVYHSSGDGSLENALVCVYGADIAEHIKPVSYDDGYVLIEGYCGDEYLARNNRVHQSVYINGRYIRSQQISYAVQRAYNTRLMVGRFPFFVLKIRISPREVDVNVHPNKLTVRFRDEERIASAVHAAIRFALEHKEEASIAPETAEAKPVENDIYSVFQRDRNAPVYGIPVPETADNPEGQTAPKEITVIPAPAPKETPAVIMHDSASSAPAVEAMDLNGVVHYTFAHEPEKKPERSEAIEFDLRPYSIIGVAFDTYILVEQGESVFCIDQHAAHERILYEKLIRDELKFDSQILLTARVINLSPTEHAVLTENIDRFRELGFEIEEFGATSVSVHAIPAGVRHESVDKLVHDMIDIIRSKGGVSELDLVRSSLIQSSCKHAIKGGQMLDKRGIEEILGHYADGSTPLTCPHGRPVMIRYSRRDFEKAFKRID
jgi:DNA mismatch repair protein MutL